MNEVTRKPFYTGFETWVKNASQDKVFLAPLKKGERVI